MVHNLKYFAPVVLLLLAVLVWVSFSTTDVRGAQGTKILTSQPGYLVPFTFFTATTTTATSTNVSEGGYQVIAGAKKVVFYFSRGGAVQPNTGSTQFLVQVSPDGTNWYDYGQLRQATSTSANPNTYHIRNDSLTISAATSTLVAEMDMLGFYAVRCIARETTDGEHTCSSTAEF